MADGVEYGATTGRWSTSPFPIRWRLRETPPPVELEGERRAWIHEMIAIDADEGIATRRDQEARLRYVELLGRRWGA